MKNTHFCFILGGFMTIQSALAQKPEVAATYATKAPFGITDANMVDKYLKIIEGVGTSAKDALNEQSLKS